MNDFVTALQFLTRFRIVTQNNFTASSFADSVRYFPLVGIVIGVSLCALNLVLDYLAVGIVLKASILVISEIIITGGLLCDGFMDTADGVFSGRERERMLEIMKDSCVGSNAVLAIIILLMLKISLYLELSGMYLQAALYIMPLVTRSLMVYNIKAYNYARKEGIGGMFRQDLTGFGKNIFSIILFLLGLLPLIYYPQIAILFIGAIMVAILYNKLAADYLCAKLGGLTGDTYGALAESGNVIFLLAVYIIFRLQVLYM